MSILFLDFETRSAVDIKKCGADVYARDPSTDVMCMGYAFDDEPADLWNPDNDRVNDHVSEGGTVVAHNAAFELAIWNHVMTRNYFCPQLKPEQMLCTMAMSYAMALPGALADAAPAAGMTMQKDSAGHRVMMQLSQPRDILPDGTIVWWDDREKFKKLFDYCKTDIDVERELFKRLMRLSPQEQKLWVLDHKINQRGVEIDLKSVKAAIDLVEAEKKRFNEKIREVTNGAVATVTATGQLTDWLRSKGLNVEGVAKSDVIDLLSDPQLPLDAREALLLRQEAAKSSTAKLEAMRRGVCDDGRLRGLFQYHGAGATGRFAGRRIQPQNFPRPRISQEDINQVFGILESIA